MISDLELFGPWAPKTYHNRYLLDQAEGRSCVKCGRDDKTIVAAHYHGRYANLFGRGYAKKSDDFMAAHLCHFCHWQFDTPELDKTEYNSEEERELELLVCIARTWRRLIDIGMITIAKGDA